MSMVENLENIKKIGIEEFLKSEEKWKCNNCGEVVCVHRKVCGNCKTEYAFDSKFENK